VAAETALRNQHEEKDDALDELVDALKADLGYAEIAVRDAPQKLNALGWRPATPRRLSVQKHSDRPALRHALAWRAPVTQLRISRLKTSGGSAE